MKKRLKIILTIISMCLIIGTGTFGVYALTQLSLTFNTSIGFISPIKKIAVHISVTGQKDTTIQDIYYDPEGHYTDAQKAGAKIEDSLDSSWALGTLEFKDDGENALENIVITIQVTNLETTAINTALSSSSTFTNVTPTYVNATAIGANATKSSTITLSIDDFGSNIEFNAAFVMTIS